MAIEKNRIQLQEEELTDVIYIKGLCFDGRKDQTMTQLNARQVIISEENIAMIQQPEGSRPYSLITGEFLSPIHDSSVTGHILSKRATSDVIYLDHSFLPE
uniref:Uncharacterized protein n=1 Tax=Timema tahoe TaxID=61484 RepID=A0A7R9IQI2_9NEOP|nr:unnamed protein product [Timema tahoe]